MKRLPLGDPVAERRYELTNADGSVQDVLVRIGQPEVVDPDAGTWGCPMQVETVGVGQVITIYGEDSMQALCLTFPIIRAELDVLSRRGRLTLDGGENLLLPVLEPVGGQR